MHPKATAWVSVKASPYIKMPIKRVMEGAIYCIKPTIYKGKSLAQPVKNKRGVAVATPAPTR